MKPIRLLLTLAASVADTFLAIQISRNQPQRKAASPVCGKSCMHNSGIERL